MENSVEPVLLSKLSIEEACQQIKQAVKAYSAKRIEEKDLLEKKRLKKIADLLNKRNMENRSKRGKSF